MRGIHEWKLEAKNVKSLCWQGDSLVDWVSGGNVYKLDGTVIPRHVAYSYRFDAAIVSPAGDYAVIYERLGTKGLVLHKGNILREINRSFYYAHAYEFPVALFRLPDGRDGIAHCSDAFNLLDLEEVETGQKLTPRVERKRGGIFHSRLAVNQSGTMIMSAGWVWQPTDILAVFSIEEAIKEPSHLDYMRGISTLPALDYVDSAAFLGNDKIIVTSSLEVMEDTEDDEIIRTQPAELSVYDLMTGEKISHTTPEDIVGTVLPISPKLVVGFYEHPKLISLTSGKTLYRWPELQTGKQGSSILWTTKPLPPPIALDPIRRRFAVAGENSITVIQVDHETFLQADTVNNL